MKILKIKELSVIRKILLICSAILFMFVFGSILAYNLGCFFLHIISITTAFFAIYFGRLKGRYVSKIMNVLLLGFMIIVVWSSVMLGLIINGQYSDDTPENAVVIVLGARVNDSGVSKSLSARLDVAYDYLIDNPNSVCIVTGGQGYDEPMTEAQASFDYLIDLGIDADRIYVEDESTSTYENFANSLEIIKENGLSTNIVITTHDFHMYRAKLMATEQGYTAYGVCAKSSVYMYPSYYGREILALTKYFIQCII